MNKADVRPERRRAQRAALRLNATIREGGRSRVQARVIDISTHGCRIQVTSAVSDDAWIWLSIAGLETQYCRVVWHCQEFIGLEFAKPLAEAVLEKLLEDQKHLPASAITELRGIATRTHWLARQGTDDEIHPLAELSRKCAVDAVVEGFRLSEAGAAKSGKARKSPPAQA